jgi:hypothetical protein
MRFEKGKRFEDRYHTPMGPVALEILTNDLVNTLSYEGTCPGRFLQDVSG